MPLDPSHPDYWTEILQFTSTIHRDVYPAIDPTNEKIRGIAHDQVVLVTGAGGGFGEGACRQWARAGARAIILAARNQERITHLAANLREMAPAIKTLALATDVSSEKDADKLFTEAINNFGQVDVVIHAAGVLGPVVGLKEASVDEWWRAFEINTKGTFLIARALARVSHGREATFIQTGTAASYFASSGQSSYIAAKAAGNMLVDQLHAECSNIRAFNVHPGMAKSPVLRKELEVYAKDTRKIITQPVGNPAPQRLTSSSELAELFGSLTIYLAGKHADFLRGRFIVANWDVQDLENHKDEIVMQGLLKSQPFKGKIGPGGHWKTSTE